jgi:predicted CxxxxCH...CXXCH cytochrome family protein
VNNILAGRHSTHWAVAINASTTDRTTAANNSTTTEYIFTCAVCHNGVQHAGGSVSADQAAEIVFDTTVAGGGTYTAGTAQGQDPNGYNWTAGTCSSTYCHSDGNGGGPNNTSFNWASPVGTLDCKGCHKYTAASGDPIASGKHSAHVGTAASPKYAFSCSKCHNATTDGVSITDKTKHVNHTKDVVFDTLNPSGAYDSGTKACASLYCHSDGAGGAPNVAVDWATATLPTDCTGCHNNDVTSGSPMATGNHTEHINNASVIGTNRTCDDCHNATVSGNRTIVDYTLHVNGTKNVVFAISGTYDAGTKQCSTVYCHSNGQVGTSVEQYITMTWGDATDIGCNGCHGTGNSQGYPDYVSGGAGTDTANSHPKHVANAGINCSECHNETTQDNVSIVAGSTTHLNQVEDVVFDPAGNNSTATYDINTKTCSTTYCHGTGTPQWGGTVNCGECHPANNTLAGSHSKHYESATTASDRSAANNSTTAEYIFNCGVCHYSTPHADGPVNANRAAQVAFDGVIGSGTYTEGATSQTDPASGFKYTNATCSNVYCHGNFPGNGNNATPEWGNASSAACGTCHDVDTSTTMDGGSHNTHVKNLGFGCDLCHSTTTDATPSIIDKTKHANGAVTWDLGDGIYLQVSASSTYRGLNAGERDKSLMGPPYGQCDNIYCHSNVQTSPPGGALTYQQPQWGGTVNCGDCHKAGPYGPGLEQDTGSHLKHVSLSTYNISCSNCHSGAGSGTQNHANYEVNVNIDPTWGAGASYSGTLQPGDAYGSCSNVYCHSIGDTAVTAGQLPAAYGGSIYATPTWGNTLSCNSCHGRTTTNGMPDYTSGGQGTETANSHPKHVQTQAYSCKECHYSTTKDGTTIDYSTGTHVNGTNTDVVFDATGPNSGGSYNATTKECSNVYCHSDGKGTYQTPIWGGTVACGDCHAVPPPTGSHTVHFGGTATEAAYGDDSNISTATTYKFNCGNCHPLNMTSHGDGVVEVELYNASATGFKANNPSTASYDSNNKQCSNVYCHSDGRDATVRTYQTTPQWGSTFAGNKCAGCHGDPPMYANGGAGTASANSHYTANEFMGTEGGHLVGLHWDNIYDAQNGGLLARGGTVGSGAAHGDPNTSTTISCNLCHAATVNWTSSTQYSTLSGAGTAFACANCHDGTQAFANASGVITDKSKHVNASRDVQFASITFKSRAQLRDQSFTDQIQPLGWTRNNGYKTGATSYDSVNLTGSYNSSTKTCTTACHLNQPVQWGDNTGVTCNSCHTGL